MTSETSETAASLMGRQIEAYNARDNATFGATVAEDMDYRDHGSGMSSLGREAFVANVVAWRSVWSDVQATIVTIVDGGADVALEVRFAGTHDGPLPTPGGLIPATGRPISIETVMVAHAENGLITSLRYYYSMLSALQQIGAMPGPG